MAVTLLPYAEYSFSLVAVEMVKTKLSRIQGRNVHLMADILNSQQDCQVMTQVPGQDSPTMRLQSGSPPLLVMDADHTAQIITTL